MARTTENYLRSKQLETIPNLKVTKKTKTLYHKLRELPTITEKQLQELSTAICDDIGMRKAVVKFEGRQPSRTNGKRMTEKTLGNCSPLGIINVFRYTAARKQQRSPKGAIETLLHEVCHHIDFAYLNIDSVHTSGFWIRLRELQDAIKS